MNKFAAVDPEPPLKTSCDAVLGGRVTLEQPVKGLRAGHDAILLAAALPLDREHASHLLDVGTGTGVVALCALNRATAATAVGIDIDPDLIALARKNAERNECRDRAYFGVGDVTSIAATMDRLSLTPNSLDHACANPPFFEHGTVRVPQSPRRNRSHVHAAEALDGWVRFIVQALRPCGTATLVHRAEALPQLVEAMSGRFGAISLRPIHPRATSPAHRILFHGVKGARAPLAILPPLILHEEDGRPTSQARDILEHAAPISMKA